MTRRAPRRRPGAVGNYIICVVLLYAALFWLVSQHDGQRGYERIDNIQLPTLGVDE